MLRVAVVAIVSTLALVDCAAYEKCGLKGCTGDAAITAAVRHQFAGSPALSDPSSVSVQTIAGVVYLRGLVATPGEIETAGELARQAPGVSDVENLLAVENAH